MSEEKPKRSKPKPMQPTSVSSAIELFVYQIESLSKAMSPSIKAIGELLGEEAKAFVDFTKQGGLKKKRGEPGTLQIPADKVQAYRKRFNSFFAATLASRNIPISHFISLVCQFDAYIGHLLRNLFILKPEVLNSSQRELTFADLMGFESLEEARHAVIEREIEAVIRDSHAAHFDWMEKRFDIALRKGLDRWPIFIEATERRNLFVHCDGVVTSQYLTVCKKHNCDLPPDCKKGDQLDVSPDYFDNAFKCLYELGVKLGHVLWRKVEPTELKAADDHLNNICFSLLSEERYDLAHRLLDFASNTLPKHASDESRRIFVINHGIAHKFQGETDKLSELLKVEDWSACKPTFQLAVAVLQDEYERAGKLMRQMGKKAGPTKDEYATWPLFKEFRTTEEFLKAYRAVFRSDFKLEEPAPMEVAAVQSKALPPTSVQTKSTRKKAGPTKKSTVPRKTRGRASRAR